MPTTTTKKRVVRKPRVTVKPTVSPLKEDAPVITPTPEQVGEREFWVLRIAPQWEDFTGPEYFYDGEIHVEKGTARVPVERIDWVSRLLFSNYSFTSEQDERDFNATIR